MNINYKNIGIFTNNPNDIRGLEFIKLFKNNKNVLFNKGNLLTKYKTLLQDAYKFNNELENIVSNNNISNYYFKKWYYDFYFKEDNDKLEVELSKNSVNREFLTFKEIQNYKINVLKYPLNGILKNIDSILYYTPNINYIGIELVIIDIIYENNTKISNVPIVFNVGYLKAAPITYDLLALGGKKTLYPHYFMRIKDYLNNVENVNNTISNIQITSLPLNGKLFYKLDGNEYEYDVGDNIKLFFYDENNLTLNQFNMLNNYKFKNYDLLNQDKLNSFSSSNLCNIDDVKTNHKKIYNIFYRSYDNLNNDWFGFKIYSKLSEVILNGYIIVSNNNSFSKKYINFINKNTSSKVIIVSDDNNLLNEDILNKNKEIINDKFDEMLYASNKEKFKLIIKNNKKKINDWLNELGEEEIISNKTKKLDEVFNYMLFDEKNVKWIQHINDSLNAKYLILSLSIESNYNYNNILKDRNNVKNIIFNYNKIFDKTNKYEYPLQDNCLNTYLNIENDKCLIILVNVLNELNNGTYGDYCKKFFRNDNNFKIFDFSHYFEITFDNYNFLIMLEILKRLKFKILEIDLSFPILTPLKPISIDTNKGQITFDEYFSLTSYKNKLSKLPNLPKITIKYYENFDSWTMHQTIDEELNNSVNLRKYFNCCIDTINKRIFYLNENLIYELHDNLTFYKNIERNNITALIINLITIIKDSFFKKTSEEESEDDDMSMFYQKMLDLFNNPKLNKKELIDLIIKDKLKGQKLKNDTFIDYSKSNLLGILETYNGNLDILVDMLNLSYKFDLQV